MRQFSIIYKEVISMTIGSRIMYMRKLRKMTQAQLGDLLGVSYMTIRRWETGKSQPRLEEINELAKIFDTSVEYFMGLQDDIQDKDSPNMAYWGGVLDNARLAVKSGKNLGLIYSLLADATGTIKAAMV